MMLPPASENDPKNTVTEINPSAMGVRVAVYSPELGPLKAPMLAVGGVVSGAAYVAEAVLDAAVLSLPAASENAPTGTVTETRPSADGVRVTV